MATAQADKSDTQASTNPANKGRVAQYAGPYRLLETLGKGGLATVKVGVDFATGTRVAVKIIDKEKLSNPREQVSMAREITIMKVLKHKNVLRLHDVYENEDKIFLILDLHEGGDLYGHLTSKGAMRPSEAVHLFRQIIAGLEYCHSNLIVHRDLKPENLLLSRDKKSLVISDFGLSTGMNGSRNYLKTRCGTVHYISPEVAKGDPYVGMASDVWSVGIILYAMVTASLPFDGENSIAVLKRIVKGEYTMPAYLPRELQDLIRRMLDLDPQHRITIHEIKRHSWFKFGFDSEADPVIPSPPTLNITLQDLDLNKDIVSNLVLLGWQEEELKDELLNDVPESHAKMFYNLLLKNRSKPISPLKGKTAESERKEEMALEARVEASNPVESPEPEQRAKEYDSTDDSSKTDSNSSSTPTSSPVESPQASPLVTPTASPAASPPRPSRPPTNLKMSAPAATRRRAGSVDKPDDAKNIVVRRRSSKKTSQERRPITRTVETAESKGDNASDQGQSSEAPRTRARASTIDSPQRAPLASSSGGSPSSSKREGWVHSPSADPGSKVYHVHSKKDIGQILENLKHCFNDMSLEVVEKKSKTGSLKVKGKLTQGRATKNMVKVNIQTSEDGTTSLEFKKSVRTSKDEFQGVIKKVEETLAI